MPRSKKEHDPTLNTLRVSRKREFWGSHDLTDYWDLTRKAEFDVDIQPRVFLTATTCPSRRCSKGSPHDMVYAMNSRTPRGIHEPGGA